MEPGGGGLYDEGGGGGVFFSGTEEPPPPNSFSRSFLVDEKSSFLTITSWTAKFSTDF